MFTLTHKKLICHKVSMISSKIKAVRNLKSTVVLILSFSLSKIDECTCRVLWPLNDFYKKNRVWPSLVWATSDLKKSWTGLWSFLKYRTVQPVAAPQPLEVTVLRLWDPLGHQKDLKLCTSQFDEFFYEAAAFRTKGNSRVCCWSVQHCTVKASKNEGQQQEGGPRLLLEVAHTGDFSA